MSESQLESERRGGKVGVGVPASFACMQREENGGVGGGAQVKTRNSENLSSVSGCTLKICRHRVSHTKMALSIEFCQEKVKGTKVGSGRVGMNGSGEGGPRLRTAEHGIRSGDCGLRTGAKDKHITEKERRRCALAAAQG